MANGTVQANTRAYLDASSSRFQAIFDSLDAIVQANFPGSEAIWEWNLPGWRVAVPNPPPEAEWKGTLPRTHLVILASEKKAGLTFHVWHPSRPSLLADEAAWLKDAGFKPMVGCVQWNRKAEPPMDEFARLLRVAKDALE